MHYLSIKQTIHNTHKQINKLNTKNIETKKKGEGRKYQKNC